MSDEAQETRPKHLGGRPSDYTQDTADRICAELADGRSLRSVCAEPDMPSRQTVFAWLRTRPEFLDQYRRAKEEAADAMADDIMDIADDGTNDWMEQRSKEGTVIGWRENGEAIGRSRLRVDARKWIASKLKPKVFGDRVQTELTGADGGPIQTADLTEVELARRIAFALQSGAQKAPTEY